MLLTLMGCIGTDYLDDPKDSDIVTNVNSVSMMVGGQFQIEATYHYNMWVPKPEVQLDWQSQNALVAEVDEDGLVNALAKGQTTVVISYPGEDTTSVLVNVVNDLTDVASVTLSSSSSSLEVGANVLLDVQVQNIAGSAYTGTADTIWYSNLESVGTVNQMGLVTGVGNGVVGITATVDGITSEPLQLMVGMQGRVGTFQSVGSYDAIGTANLVINDNEELILTLSDDFKTSFALGTFVYLANSVDGSVVRAQGREIAEITTNGGKTFNITEKYPDITLSDYQYVIILCKPASITFGYADLN